MSLLKLVCPKCGLPLEIEDDVLDGELVEHDCGTIFEVKKVNGVLKLDEFNEPMEDWGE